MNIAISPIDADFTGQAWNAARELTPEVGAFEEQYWETASRHLLMGLLIYMAVGVRLEKRTPETLILLLKGGPPCLKRIRETCPSGAAAAWLTMRPGERYEAAVMADCLARVLRYLHDHPGACERR